MRPAPTTPPDRAALDIAHRQLATPTPLDAMLQVPALKRLLYALARRHMRRRTHFDPKKQQANDLD